MFGDLLKNLMQPDPPRLPDPDARLALTSLLVRIARTDGHYDDREKSRILSLTRSRYGLSEAQSLTLLAEAEAIEADAPDTVRFTRAIKEAVAYEERTGVIEALWAIVLADGARDTEEDAMMRLVASLLGVNDMDSNLARRRVQGLDGA